MSFLKVVPFKTFVFSRILFNGWKFGCSTWNRYSCQTCCPIRGHLFGVRETDRFEPLERWREFPLSGADLSVVSKIKYRFARLTAMGIASSIFSTARIETALKRSSSGIVSHGPS